MNYNLHVYGKSKFAKMVATYFSEKKHLNSFELDEYPKEKLDGLVLSFIDDMKFSEVIEIAKLTKQSGNKTLFISSFSSRKMVLGTTHLANDSACVDSMLYYLLYQKHSFSSDAELMETKIPAFDKVLSDTFYKRVYSTVLNKIITEASQILANELVYLKYVNKAETLYIKTGKSKEEFILPLFEGQSDSGSMSDSIDATDVKVQLSDYLNTRSNSRYKNYHRTDSGSDYKSVGVVGGGTAGYLTAIALKNEYPELEVTLIESSKIPIVGVGEATTPILPGFLFKELKFDKLDFYKRVQPTWKLGIKFFWGKPDDYYFNYPFGGTNLLAAYLNGNINECSLNSILMSKNSSFVFEEKVADESQYFSLSDQLKYAYHLDNKKFVQYLYEQAIKLGVVHKDAQVDHVETFTDKEGIDFVKTKDGETLKYDFYVDCTGFKSLLMGGALKSEYLPYTPSLFTDRAVVAVVPNDDFVKPYTYAESMDHGWCWNIPMRDSDHRGYVYSSDFVSEEDAVKEMRAKNPTMGDHKLIRFKTGRHHDFVKSNVCAIGNAYGFVEPLESTGIHMIIREVQTLRDNFRQISKDNSGVLRGIISKDMNDQWDYLRWFLSIHYKFNNKYNTPFWKEARANTDVSGLDELIDVYENVGLLKELPKEVKEKLKNQVHDHLFGLGGIDNLLLGQGFVPKTMDKTKFVNETVWKHNVTNWHKLADASVALKDDLRILTENPSLM